MKKTILLSLIAAPFLYAGEFNPKQIPADAAWYLHSNVEALRDTKAGKMAMAVIAAEGEELIDVVETQTGYDLLHDTHDFTLFGSGKDDEGAVIIRGDFKERKLLSLVTQNDTYEKEEHRDLTIHSWVDEDSKKQNYAVFPADKTLVISEQLEEVKKTIDVFAGETAHLGKPAPELQKSPLFLGLAQIGKIEIPEDDEGAKIIQKAKSIALSLTEDGNSLSLKGLIETKNQKSAKQIKTILDGLIALALISLEEGGEESATHQLSVDENIVRGEVRASLQDVVSFLQEQQDDQKK